MKDVCDLLHSFGSSRSLVCDYALIFLSTLSSSQEKEDVKTLDEAYICLKLACLTKNAPPNIVEYFGAAMLPSHTHPSTIQLFLELMPSECFSHVFLPV